MHNTTGADPHEMVRPTEAENPFQAHIWEQALADEGVRSQVLGDYLDAGLGDIPGIKAEVWVAAADLERAATILREHQKNALHARPPAAPSTE